MQVKSIMCYLAIDRKLGGDGQNRWRNGFCDRN